MPQRNIKLSPDASAIHQQLKAHIISKIEESGGILRFADFMQAALYTPQLGYYQNALHTFGEAGDFVTAPEMGELFGRCIAESIAALTVDSTHRLLEFGAGSGALACQILSRLTQKGCPPASYQILEPSGALQQLQQANLISAIGHEEWPGVEWLTQLPDKFIGVLLGNEVVDALPVERIQKTADGWQYLGVAFDGEDFYWQPAGSVELGELPPMLSQQDVYIEGYTTEIRPLLRGWIKGLAECLESGCILLFDYGYPQAEYYHPQRTEGSLRCFSRHQANDDPLSLVGLQDITAHVDFTALAEAAVDAGLEVTGFTTQAGFLLENGILERMPVGNLKNTVEISRQLQLLTAPGQMGELVKVILLSKNSEPLAKGFTFQDHLHRL